MTLQLKNTFDLLLSVDECVFGSCHVMYYSCHVMFMSCHVIACNIHCICHSM